MILDLHICSNVGYNFKTRFGLGMNINIGNSQPQHFDLGKTVYSILPQSTQLQRWVPRINKAQLRVSALYTLSCSGISLGGLNSHGVYRPARGGRSWAHFSGYKTINRIPFYI